ncbi:putative ribonuclease H-like domain-containing protein [Tanacetum coccineum]
MTHPSPKRNKVPKAALMRSGLVSLTTARPVNTAQPRTTVNSTRPMKNVFNKAYSIVRRPINNKTATKNSNFNKRVNTVSGKNVNTARPKAVVNVARPKAVLNVGNLQMDLQDQRVIDSGCSRHMTGNVSCLTDFEEIDGGYVVFGGNLKGGKITRRVPKKNNMYSVDLKNIIPKGELTCLFSKATSDESKFCHRRLGHINFKTMNKLVKGNLVSGLPSKLFENDLTCVACQKGKQHRASLVIDDYSRFSWVFFLATKDGNSGILKSFITGVENLIDQRVKLIRCDNGTEFKNKEMNQLCERKGIKREFSVARTPQQKGIAKRKNRTLIEAARTMLADSKLPTIFWAEAVNTACYVQNRVLVIKPHNKTPYELFLGNQSNGNAGTKACDDTGKARMETVPGKDYILLPLWPADLPFSQNSKSSLDVEFKPSGDDEKNITKEPGKEGGDSSKEDESNDQEKDDNVNSTNNVNAASTNEVNAVGRKSSIELLDDLNMPGLEDIVYSDDDKDVGAEADMNNLDTFMLLSPILTTRIHKDHPVEQIIGDLNSAPQTRRMTKNLEEHEGIDYDEVFTPVARIEAIRLFLDYASFKDFMMYQMDVKSDFLYDDIIFGSTKKSLCIEFEKIMHKKFQMSYMGKLTFFLGLQVKQKEDGIFISQDKYVTEILKKFGFTDVKTASTPMETQKPLLKDEDGEEVDVHLYTSMIGSLMYLTYSRHDIMFAMCAYARYQGNPKVSHLHAVKRIFRYLKGQLKLGLWCPKDSPFDLVAYTDSDYARASLDRMKQKSKRSKRKDIKVPQPSDPINVADEAVNEEPSMQLKELMDFCTKLQQRVLDLENTKTAQAQEITSLHGDEVFVEKEVPIKEVSVIGKVNTASIATTVSAAIITEDEITLAQALPELKSVKPKVTTITTTTTKGILLQEPSESTTTTTTTTIPLKHKVRLVKEKDEANVSLIEEWNEIQAKIETDYELAQRLQAEEQEELTVDEKATLFQQLLEKRRKHFAAKRAEEKINRPPTRAQQRTIMCSEMEESSKKVEIAQESSSKRAGDELEQENAKKQKVDNDQEAAKMKELMKIVPDEEEVAVDAIPLATKPPSIMLRIFDREDLETLWKLIKAKHGYTRPEEGYERVLWGDLKTMFEHHVEDAVSRNLRENKVLVWKLFDSCRVHFMRFQSLHVFMLVEKGYPLIPAIITDMLNKKLQVDH